MTLQTRRQPFCVCSDARFNHVLFYVLNFPELYRTVRSDLHLKADGWRITLQQVPKAKQIYEDLSETGGYAFTHVGEIKRDDGKSFSGEQARSLLGTLHFFLSFSAGAWTPPVFPVGLNTSGERVWEEWGYREKPYVRYCEAFTAGQARR